MRSGPTSLAQLKGELVIAKGTELNEILTALKEKYPDLNWKVVDKTQEELLIQVADAQINYSIANSIYVSSTQQIKPNLAVAFDVTDETKVHWYLPNNSYNELQAALLDSFMDGAIETGLVARIEEKYFNHLGQFDYVDTRSYLNAIETILPKYQPLRKNIKVV